MRDIPPWSKTGNEIEGAVLLRNKRMEYVREEVDGGRAFRIVGREGDSEFEDGIGVIACARDA